ncbi:gluconate 2-dehydrogenase subunit 3 family protein [Deinococcus aquiradiocola]|uniref:Gluconate 2-dehydrogenase subunit 3 family protein n=1 Tax=Deinococcus aquiradiocola TaxID=393059 RepID=A0A917PAU8_9DEIO|nr:gluconate 2-dehydrogenase subunit 3 family protein [Deinococcus aquiradiocola]GGJ69040.1 hypothetical protein GCM10008939_11890 [Deinococcus aquiradiocola]
MTADRDPITRLLQDDRVTAPTRAALTARLNPATVPRPHVFNFEEFARLEALSVRLVPHDPAHMPLARRIDARLASGDTDGWRYDHLPPDEASYRALLAALPGDFTALDGGLQDEALHALQAAHPHAFEDLLAELTEGYYSHPAAQAAIGYVGFADAHGWTETRLDRLDPNEAAALALLRGEDA